MTETARQKRRDTPAGGGKIAARRRNARERLVRTGSRLFAERGIANVSVENILAEVKISRRTFYGYFANKYELAAGAINAVLGDGAEILGEYSQNQQEPWLPCIVDCYLRLWSSHRNALAVISDLSPDVMPYIDDSHRRFGSLLKELLKNAQEADELRNDDAGCTFRIITKTAVPLLKIYADHPDGERLYRESMLALLGTPE